jgi:hypothetical protein
MQFNSGPAAVRRSGFLFGRGKLEKDEKLEFAGRRGVD